MAELVEERAGLDWDEYFMSLASAVSRNSKCLSRKIGAVLIKDKSVIATGYNGPPRGCLHCEHRYFLDKGLIYEFGSRDIKISREGYFQCPRRLLGFKSGEGLAWCIAGHAEQNAINNAARMGVCTNGSMLYCNCGVPCKNCLISIVNAGIEEVICLRHHSTNIIGEYYDRVSEYIVRHSHLRIRKIDWR